MRRIRRSALHVNTLSFSTDRGDPVLCASIGRAEFFAAWSSREFSVRNCVDIIDIVIIVIIIITVADSAVKRVVGPNRLQIGGYNQGGSDACNMDSLTLTADIGALLDGKLNGGKIKSVRCPRLKKVALW
ncbi:uncharacterized protein MAM_04078 [Metarhizium album ARSEF 1941]|uniref:Uncharacterized protein n=1 Tax=Metarhizium album (strain ARSEF 1941) TaxID=1081103 RepID=A0A0B2WY37_METAS|nr:uncharacterized protein MAM_04078 [Metarhizium album ARSEF 1941]KHN98317.1 hypothetical protein MAM_04078 [Metarhizium album ARSEF 1941]